PFAPLQSSAVDIRPLPIAKTKPSQVGSLVRDIGSADTTTLLPEPLSAVDSCSRRDMSLDMCRNTIGSADTTTLLPEPLSAVDSCSRRDRSLDMCRNTITSRHPEQENI
uniref:Uncharacterized protein n=1 Tax=Parascaris univalens TaxID=6257 RepID=A0A915CFY3_PARUN